MTEAKADSISVLGESLAMRSRASPLLTAPGTCVFGSVGRGEAGARDLDLLVEMIDGRSLFDLIALSNELEDTLGIEVDVVSERGLSPYLRDRIPAEAVPL